MTQWRHLRMKEKSILQIIYDLSVIIVKIILLAISFYLVYIGIRYSYYSATDYEQVAYQVLDSVWIHLCLFAGICLLASVLLNFGYLLVRFQKEKRTLWDDKEKLCKMILVFSCIVLAVVEYIYITNHPYYPSGDQLNTTAGAAYARAGNYLMFSKGGYIALYEQQKGLLFLYEILFTIFGDYCYDVAAKFHLLLSIVTLVSGYYFMKIVMKKVLYRILYCGLMITCIPYIIYLPYIYGDLPSICFTMVLFWALAVYGQKLQKRYILCCAVVGALALLMRMHTLVTLIAVGIGMILMAFQKRKLRPILAAICIILAAEGAVKSLDIMYELRSGYESNVGVPHILWIAMGLQETDGYPGVYNRYQQTVFEENHFDREISAQIGKEYIIERLREMKANPAYCRYFFTTKVKIQWLEPLFEGLYATSTFDEKKEIPDWMNSLYYGKFHDVVWKFSNYYQSIIYMAFFAFVLLSFNSKDKMSKNCVVWIPLITIIGGFFFSMIWESQCRYVLPYYVYMVIYAAVGMGKISEYILFYGVKLLHSIRSRV